LRIVGGLPARDAADNPPVMTSTLDFRFDPDPRRDEPLLDGQLREQLGLPRDPREQRADKR
jgi:hypothetical protein